MTSSTDSEYLKSNNRDIDLNGAAGQSITSFDLLSDPDYTRLLEDYQRGEFSECIKRFDMLKIRYPGHPMLLKFKKNIDYKLALKSMTLASQEEEKLKKIKFLIKVGYLIVFITFFVLMVIFSSYYLINKSLSNRLTEDEIAQIILLDVQIEKYLLEGQPEEAAVSLERIREIDPDYENIPMLASKIYDMLLLVSDYREAMSLLAEGRKGEALGILMKIEQEVPGLWDVNQQISIIQNSPTP